MATAEIKKIAKKHGDRLHPHSNVEATQLMIGFTTTATWKRHN
jgi:hypothetical protein